MENIVFLELQRQGRDIFYYRTHTGAAVDFIIRRGERVEQALQVTWSLAGTSRDREVTAMVAALEELSLGQGLILTDNEDEEIIVGNKKIIVQPVFRWLLENGVRGGLK